jgi:IS5 family transposase
MLVYKKLLNNSSGNSLIDTMEQIISDLEKDKKKEYIRNIKYTTREYICEIIQVLSNSTSWRKHIGKIDGRVLNNKHNYYVKIGVYEKLHKLNLKTYLKKNINETKVLSLDSTFIPNKNGTEKIGRNTFYKSKKGIKLTTIVDSKGIPLKMCFNKGNRHDARIAPKILNKLDPNKTNNKYILADKGYDSKKIRRIIRSKNYKPIIARRKTNKKQKLLTKREKRIYKKRIIVENSFSWIRMFAKIDRYYEKTLKSFNGLILLAFSIIIFKRC